MKRYLFYAILLLIVKNSAVFAQPVLYIAPSSVYIANDTLPGNSTDSVAFRVRNIGTANFNDTITFYTGVWDSTGFIFNTVDSASFYGSSILAGDSLQFSLNPTYTIAPTKFHYDINVIVIWPVAQGAVIADSVEYTEVLTIPDGIDEIDTGELIHPFPNPVLHDLGLENTGKNAIEEVRIYDSRGRLLQVLKNPQTICTEEWSAGVYILKAVTAAKKIHTIRVIKQK